MLTGESDEMVFVEESRQSFRHKQQIALQQPHRNRCGDGRQRSDADDVADGLFARPKKPN